MVRFCKSQRRLFACIIAVALLCGFFAFLSKSETQAESSAASERIDEDTELIYYLKVRLDGIDHDGVESNDSTKVDIRSNEMQITDKIPDGLIFEGFVTGVSNAISAYERDDHTVACAGAVLDDTRELPNSTGTWDGDNYYWHGLHYSNEDRTVRFRVRGLQAGCELTVGIKTRTPFLGDTLRMDFYNNSNVIDRDINILSNTVHNWMAKSEVASTYTVTYRYTGDVPASAPSLPDPAEYAEGSTVSVMNKPVANGYSFNGWNPSTEDSDLVIENNAFVMPSRNVVFEGSFEELPQYELSYVVEGETPEGYVAPSAKSYYADERVKIDELSAGDEIDDYVFSGWTIENVEIDEGYITMPEANIVAKGSFTRKEYTVSYAYVGDVPENAPAVPAPATYHRGDFVQIADKPVVDGYVFHGWDHEDFYIEDSNVEITGYFTEDRYFTLGIAIEITNPKDAFVQGDVVNFDVTITNENDFEVTDLTILELLDGAKFIEGDGYSLTTDSVAGIASIPPFGKIVLKAQFEVTENKDATYENIVEIALASAGEGLTFDTENNRASIEFKTKAVVNPITLVGSKKMFAIAGACIIIVAAVVVYKKTSRRNVRLARRGAVALLAVSFMSFGTFVIWGIVSAAPNPVDTMELTNGSDYDDAEPGSWQIRAIAELVSDSQVRVAASIGSVRRESEQPRDVLIVYGDSCSVRAGARLTNHTKTLEAYAFNSLANRIIDDVISSDNTSRIGVISYDFDEQVQNLNFTRDADLAKGYVSLDPEVSPNACINTFDLVKQANPSLKVAENYLDEYYSSAENEGRELVVVYMSQENHWFDTMSYNQTHTPGILDTRELYELQYQLNAVEYQVIKDKYPNIVINSMMSSGSYEDEELNSIIEDVGDYRDAASDKTFRYKYDINRISFIDAYETELYREILDFDEYRVSMAIDSRYFEIDEEAGISDPSACTLLSCANMTLTRDGDTIYIDADGVRSGKSNSFQLFLNFKEDHPVTSDDIYTVLSGTTVTTSIPKADMSGDTDDDSFSTSDSPSVKLRYNISYEYNLPQGCTLPDGAVQNTKGTVFQRVEHTNAVSCEGWNFEGYRIKSPADTVTLGSDAFRMPAEDVVITAAWSKPSIEKSLEGSIFAPSEAYLVSGKSFNLHLAAVYTSSQSFLNRDFFDYQVDAVRWAKSFTRSDTLPDTLDISNPIYVISTDDSPVPIYMWKGSTSGCQDLYGTMRGCADYYYYTSAEKIYMNEDSSYMLYNEQVMQDISGLRDFDTSHVKNLDYFAWQDYMLNNLTPLETWTTPNLESMDRAFEYNRSLQSLNGLGNFTLTGVTDLSYVFEDNQSLTDVTAIGNWDVSNVENLDYAFSKSGAFNTQPLDSWETTNLKSLQSTFYLSNITEVNGLSTWDNSKIENMQQTFSNSKIKSLSGLSSWTTPALTNLDKAFYATSELESLSGLEKFTTTGLTSMDETFRSSGIKNVDALEDWDITNVVTLNSTFDSSKIENTNGLRKWRLDNMQELHRTFYGAKNLTNLDGIGNWSVSTVESIHGIFDSSGITSVSALSNWKTYSLNDISYAFHSTSKLENLDGLNGWDVSGVTKMTYTFSSSGIKNLDGLNGWNTENVVELGNTFSFSRSLSDISGISGWSTKSLSSLYYTFAFTSALQSLEDLSSWTPKIGVGQRPLDGTFRGCGATSLAGIENFDISGADTMAETFSFMPNLTTVGGIVDDGNGGTKKVGLQTWGEHSNNISTYKSVFAGDTALTNVDALNTWITTYPIGNDGLNFKDVPANLAWVSFPK